MAKRYRREQVLGIVLTDNTFVSAERRADDRGATRTVWSGKCIYCNTRLDVSLDGTPISPVTIEHLRPRNHGGTDDVRNLALSCPSCNQSKGSRIDNRRKGDVRMEEVIEAALERRRARWREPQGV